VPGHTRSIELLIDALIGKQIPDGAATLSP
jgi:hypothetical protein